MSRRLSRRLSRRRRRRRPPRLEVVGETVDETTDMRVVLEELSKRSKRAHGDGASAERERRERRLVTWGLVARVRA